MKDKYRMKVAYLIGSLNRGGAETLLLDIFRKADKAPFEMMVIHRKGGMYEQEFMNLSPECIKISPRRGRMLSYLHQLRKKIQTEKITVIHSYFWLDTIYAWLATIGINIPIVHTFHGYEGSEAGMFKGIRYQCIMRMAKMLCFVSAEQMQQYERRYGSVVRKKGIVLYNGLNFDKFDVTREGVNDFANDDRIRLCMVGNFNSVRSQMVVCKALQKLKDESGKMKEEKGEWDFYFVGSRYTGEEHYYYECVAFCQEHGLDHVHFLGVRNDVPAILESMDGFVYSSNNDTFGIAVIEAIAAGLPIVVNDHPVMREVCGEANDGIRYFKTNDADEAAEAIVDMIENMADSKKAAEANAERVRMKYSIQQHIDTVNQIYLSLQ